MSSLSASPKWGQEQDHLLAALGVLAKIQPNQKIRILSSDQPSIEIDDNYWFWRTLNGDGCKETLAIISKIMDKCISYSTQKIFETGEKDLNDKHYQLVKLYEPAIKGMGHLRDLYKTYSDKERSSVAKDLDDKINVYSSSLRFILNRKENLDLPLPQPPLAEPSMTFYDATKVVVNNTIPMISRTWSLVSWTGTVVSGCKVAYEVVKLNPKNPGMNAGFLATAFCFLNMSSNHSTLKTLFNK